MLLMPTPTAEISEELLRDAFSVNVFAPFLLTGAVAPEMVQRGDGVIVNIGPVHLELLGSLEAIAAVKAELIAGMAPNTTVVRVWCSGQRTHPRASS